jgi:hypothetical protein
MFGGMYFRIARRLVEFFRMNRKKILKSPIIENAEAMKLITEAIESNSPILISRFGTTESEFCLAFVNKDLKRRIDKKLLDLWQLSGVFPPDLNVASQFFEIYTDSARTIDFCGVRSSSSEYSYWNLEEKMLSNFTSSPKLFDIEVLLPITHKDPWTAALAGKRVLVIHPFVNSISKQISNSSMIYCWLPKTTYILLQAPQSLGELAIDSNTNWVDEFENLKSKVDALQYDVALIGCGAYGLPIGSYIKQTGHVAIHVGGALQLFFGIRGRRWNEFIDENFEDHDDQWVSPSIEETPKSALSVEGGAYWIK